MENIERKSSCRSIQYYSRDLKGLNKEDKLMYISNENMQIYPFLQISNFGWKAKTLELAKFDKVPFFSANEENMDFKLLVPA